MKRPRQAHPRLLIAGSAAGIAVLALTGIGAATAYADGSNPTASPTASPGTSHPSTPTNPGPGGPTGKPGPGGAKHQPHIGGSVLSFSGSTLLVRDRDGFTRTVLLTQSAALRDGGTSTTTRALTPGQHVEATGTVDRNGTTLDATTVTIGTPTPPTPHARRGDGPHRTGQAPAPATGATPSRGAPSSTPAPSARVPAAPTSGPTQPSGAPDASATPGS